jgi:hypothetical protein
MQTSNCKTAESSASRKPVWAHSAPSFLESSVYPSTAVLPIVSVLKGQKPNQAVHLNEPHNPVRLSQARRRWLGRPAAEHPAGPEISHRAYVFEIGKIALSGDSKSLPEDPASRKPIWALCAQSLQLPVGCFSVDRMWGAGGQIQGLKAGSETGVRVGGQGLGSMISVSYSEGVLAGVG